MYGAIWLIADMEALRRNAICAGAESLELRLGLRVQAHIAWKNVECVDD